MARLQQGSVKASFDWRDHLETAAVSHSQRLALRATIFDCRSQLLRDVLSSQPQTGVATCT
jgi:hypothetical protein